MRIHLVDQYPIIIDRCVEHITYLLGSLVVKAPFWDGGGPGSNPSPGIFMLCLSKELLLHTLISQLPIIYQKYISKIA